MRGLIPIIAWGDRLEGPHIPGMDVAGEVVESRAEGFEAGQRVAARIAGTGGAAAELCLVDQDVAALIPEGVSEEQAAAVPLAGMTALQALRDDCGMALSGERRRVLVVGASGGVGL